MKLKLNIGDSLMIQGTYINIEGLTKRQVANRALKALNLLSSMSNGTISKPEEWAAWELEDGRTIIESIYKSESFYHSNDWFIIDVNEYTLYVDATQEYINDNSGEYALIENI